MSCCVESVNGKVYTRRLDTHDQIPGQCCDPDNAEVVQDSYANKNDTQFQQSRLFPTYKMNI